MQEGSRKAIIAAFFANLGIAIAKFTGFLITRSAGLLAESAHSLADTGNQALLMLGSKRGKRPADQAHPFGYGPERYFWAFVVALVLFSMGGLFALYEGINKLRHPHEVENAAVAFGILPLVEQVFRLTSDITLLELSDLNRPLLRRMQLEAPGTYHHSMVVGSLAEAAAEAIHANSLLARVQAYYHDIGKLSKPEYYAENEPASSRSRHEKLTPSMSALVVKSHISEGLDFAKKIRLPRAVRNAIPEHHGSMVMAFFFHKALETDPTARREDYSYPGPRPRSKETAILMLADGVEGASRALAEPTPSRIRGLVQRIIEERVRDGQLDEANITISELARIRESFIPVLTAIFHVRAPYPAAPKPQNKREYDSRRDA